jgi:hypothetical protein
MTKTKRDNSLSQLFSVDKVSEGGMGQKEAIRRLKEAGIDCAPGHTPYVGQSGVRVFGTQTEIDQAETILFGN